MTAGGAVVARGNVGDGRGETRCREGAPGDGRVTGPFVSADRARAARDGSRPDSQNTQASTPNPARATTQ